MSRLLLLVFVLCAAARPARADVEFRATIEPLSKQLRAEMTGVSWKPGCPVSLDDLVLIRTVHRGFDEGVHDGELVVAKSVAKKMVTVLRAIWDTGFPIERMQRIELFKGDDDASMAANNTSAFNCRKVAGKDAWSRHSYGTAIDVNPLVNPFVRADGVVQPPEGAAYVDRTKRAMGLILADDAVVRAFRKIGWKWGGAWTKARDFQHFSSDGR